MTIVEKIVFYTISEAQDISHQLENVTHVSEEHQEAYRVIFIT